MHVMYEDKALDMTFYELFEREEIPDQEEPTLAVEEQQAMTFFQSTTTHLPDGRYEVGLTKRVGVQLFGESRSTAECRLLQNERSLKNNGKLTAFQEQVLDYAKQSHVEFVPSADLSKSNHQVFYLSLHGVEKASSTMTKLRVVCDASAKSSSGVSLSDTLLPGPSLYPRLTTILQCFRTHNIASSVDIGKMFCEISVHPDDRDLLRYIVRNVQSQLED